MKGTMKEQLGTINHPIELGGVTVFPGDIVVGDTDGIVVIPKDRAREALELCKAKEVAESRIIDELKKGKLTLELLGLEATLARKGLTEEAAD